MKLTVHRADLYSVGFGRDSIQFRVLRSQRKTLAISVRPDGAVIATAPRNSDISAVELKIRKRGHWIQLQKRYFEQFLPSTPPRRYVSGETHQYLGRQYRLKVSLGSPSAKLIGRYLHVTAKTKAIEDVRPIVEKWYRTRAQEQFAKRLDKWREWCVARRIREPKPQLLKMTKRWGSSKPNGRVYLNPELVQAPSVCIDYVIAHEVCHLKFPKHDKKFYRLLTQVCPNWQNIKQRLEESLS